MRGNQLAGAAPRSPPRPGLLPFHLTFFPPLLPPDNKLFIYLKAKPTLPLTFSGPRGEQRRRTPAPAPGQTPPAAGGRRSRLPARRDSCG